MKKFKTILLIAVYAFFALGITGLIGNSVFGPVFIDGEETMKDITVMASMIFTVGTSYLIYKWNPFNIDKTGKEKKKNKNRAIKEKGLSKSLRNKDSIIQEQKKQLSDKDLIIKDKEKQLSEALASKNLIIKEKEKQLSQALADKKLRSKEKEV